MNAMAIVDGLEIFVEFHGLFIAQFDMLRDCPALSLTPYPLKWRRFCDFAYRRHQHGGTIDSNSMMAL